MGSEMTKKNRKINDLKSFDEKTDFHLTDKNVIQ